MYRYQGLIFQKADDDIYKYVFKKTSTGYILN